MAYRCNAITSYSTTDGLRTYTQSIHSLFLISRSFESHKIWVAGLIVDEVCAKPSHWKQKKSLHEWLESSGVSGIYGIDTRQLTKNIRNHGTMLGKIVTNYVPKMTFSAADFVDPNELNLVKEVSVQVGVSYFLIRSRRNSDEY